MNESIKGDLKRDKNVPTVNQSKHWLHLLEVLTENVERLDAFKNSEERSSAIDSLFYGWPSYFDSTAVTNLQGIVRHLVLRDELSISNFAESLRSGVNNELDIQTAITEATADFDGTHGTKTAFLLEQFELGESITADRFINAARYHPSPVNSVLAALTSLEKFGVDYGKFTFIDVGAGTGRNLLLASEYPFKRIIGVEISAHLAELGESNIHVYNKPSQLCKDISICRCDVREFLLPENEALILYFWEPFSDDVFELFFYRLLDIQKSRNKPFFLIFLGRVFPLVETSPVLKQLCSFYTLDKKGASEFFLVSIFSSVG